jgi:hypothetical protein
MAWLEIPWPFGMKLHEHLTHDAVWILLKIGESGLENMEQLKFKVLKRHDSFKV